MRILTVDIGTGTQDIFLYDSRLDIENGYKLIVPSPTMMVLNHIRQAIRRRNSILLTGSIMGGGPSQWGAEEALRAGLQVYATPQAAKSFNDDLEVVRQMGIELVSEDEAQHLPAGIERVLLQDFDFINIAAAFARFDISLEGLDAVAVAVFDHGNAPPGISDRRFRFDYLDHRIRAGKGLSAFAYLRQDIPPIMTRLQSVADAARGVDASLVVMDTAPAAVLGATFDSQVSGQRPLLVINVGNLHTLAFRLGQGGIEGVFEHHTGLLDGASIDKLLIGLAECTLTNDQVFGEHGHGALLYTSERMTLVEGDFGVVVTGPRRSLVRESTLRPYFAAPFGDMMIAGCFGLLAATADLVPELREEIMDSLLHAGKSAGSPWES
jgi:uncharacterized protein (DUF1786 family)